MPFRELGKGTHRLSAPLAALAAACALAFAPSCSGGKNRLYPRPAPMEVHADSDLSSGQQTRLGDIRRFLAPADQAQLERTLAQLAEDPNLDKKVGEEALQRALSGFSGAEGFCQRVRDELRPHRLSGPIAAAPERVAFAVSIREAHERWLSATGRGRFPDPKALARAVRDGQHTSEDFAPGASLGLPGEPLFVTDALAFAERKGPSAATRLCLTGPASPSYVVALIRTADLPGDLHVPTAADGACRKRFELPEAGAATGKNCGGQPEFVSAPATVGQVAEFRLFR